MTSRELPTVASIRSAREEIARNEAYLRGEHRGYANARDRAMTALNLAGGNPDASAEDHAVMTEQRGALLVSEIGRTKDATAKRALAEQLRSLADQVEDARFDIARAAKERVVSVDEEIVTVELMLLELREERRRYIEALRQAIDVTHDPALMLECCALIEEDIHASLAAGDLDGARRSTASLAAVRALLPKPTEGSADGEDSEHELAHALAAAVIGDRNSGVVAGDALWFERAIERSLSKMAGPNREQNAVKEALLEYRAANKRGKATTIADIDPKASFVDGAR
jgi:hypothetical protein